MKRYSLSVLCCMISCSLLIAQVSESIVVRIAKFKHDKPAAISYTFDDGLKEHYTLVAPELEKRGFRGTFWINGNTINRNEPVITDTTRTTWAELKEMYDRGHEISNHGWSHKKLTSIPAEEAKTEIDKNDSIILVKTGKKPVTFCYANNAKNPEVIRLASKNRVGTRTFQRSVGSKSTPEDLDKWVDELIANREWGVGMTHGISYGYDAFKEPKILWNHLDKVKMLENKIWVGTFREVAAYTQERDSIQISTNKKKNGYEIFPVLNLNKNLFNEPLTMIIKIGEMKIKSISQGRKKLHFIYFSPDEAVFDFNPSGKVIKVELKSKTNSEKN
ncbi:MAG: polysaccharide deacetylase family protein [Paludibacteraceae bacterium]